MPWYCITYRSATESHTTASAANESRFQPESGDWYTGLSGCGVQFTPSPDTA
jgi:hypothetical protein